MKKWVLFGYNHYYPYGGMGDLVDSFHSINELLVCLFKEDQEHYEIVDRDTWEVLWSGGTYTIRRLMGLEKDEPGKTYTAEELGLHIKHYDSSFGSFATLVNKLLDKDEEV